MILAATKIQAAGGVRTMAFDAGAALQLSSGETLAPLTIAFESYGALNADRSNAVLVCHALTGDQFVAGANPVTGRPAWWPRIVGPGRPIDTNRFYVICANVLGGSMGTTGPASLAEDGQPYGLRFPNIVTADIVRAQAMLIEALGIDSLFLVVGPGFGGMQALQWASAYPRRVFACATIAAAAQQTAPMLAMNELARQAIMADPDWRGGSYYASAARPGKGLAIARTAVQLGHLAEPALRSALVGGSGLAAEVEADNVFVDRFDANACLTLLRTMDAFNLSADFGGNLANAFSRSETRHCLFSFANDWLFPASAGRAVARALISAGAEAAFVEIDTARGHNAYLHHEPQLEAALTGFIDAAASARGLALQAGAN